MNMKEELTALINKYSLSKSGNDFKNIIDAIEKYDKYLHRLNLDAQRWFDLVMAMDERNRKNERL